MELYILHLLLVLAASLDGDSDEYEVYVKIKNGDPNAFKEFFDAHHAELFRYLLRRGVARDATEDLVQKAFVYVWEHRAKIDESKSLRAYLFKIAYTRMLNLFRDTDKFSRDVDVMEMAVSPASTEPDGNINQQELHQALKSAIEAMPNKRQQVFRLCFMQEFSYKEAAEFMEVSVKTIENHMTLALKDLRASLSETAENYL